MKRWCSLKGYVCRFLNKDEKIIYICSCGLKEGETIYIGSCRELCQNTTKINFERGHYHLLPLGDGCYDQVLYVDYAKFRSRTEAYMYGQYDVAKYQPEFNNNCKNNEFVELEYFEIVKEPIWYRAMIKP